jgi:hypothetical protein
MIRKSVYALVIVSLLLSSIAPLTASAARPLTDDRRPQTDDFAIYLAPADSQPLLRDIPIDLAPMYDVEAALQQPVGPYRTTVTIRGTADLARLKKLGVTILASTKTTATVVADRAQLEQLAKLQFLPRQTELTARLQTATRAPLSASATAAQILAATAVDSDNDGLNDTEEGWWCTNPNLADSDNDRVNDGAEVNALREWIAHTRATRPASGKPFAGWPPNHTGCYDSDYDSVPDAVEVYVFGLNPNRESTARDKFDDGQKLFGLTNCPGSGGGCGYGALPRQVDWGVIFAEMPSWVKPPYDSPFVAAFPDPDIEVVPSSFVVTAKTTITTDHTISNGEAKTHGTSETRGTSDARADTVTWNQWSEVSVTTPQSASQSRPRGLIIAPALGFCALHPTACATATAALVYAGKTAIECAGQAYVGQECWQWTVVKKGAGDVYKAAKSLWGSLMSEPMQGTPDNFDFNTFQTTTFPNSCIQSTQGGGVPRAPLAEDLTCKPKGQVVGISTQQQAENQGLTIYTQDRNPANQRHDYLSNNQTTSTRPVYEASYYSANLPSVTTTSGSSRGGALTTTHTEYEEHTISQSQQFSSSQSWGTATAVDTAHAADLTFTYRISNKGTDYAREIGSIAFNIYVGDDANPVYTYYPAADIGGDGKYTNFMPNESHQYASRAVPLTLNQMKAIDTGAHIYIVVEDFSYGVDELFYQDAINSGATFHVDSGDGILHSYVLPTWGTETIQDVAKRFFPATEDASGNLLSLTVPHYNTTTPTWVNHALTDTSWWNLYLNNLGDGSAAFKDTPAVANSTVLIRMNSDTDRDGYSDRTELALGTNPNDAASHPTPALTAATHSTRTGNTVSVNMAFLNSGNYDAYGVEAVLYAPDSTVTINDNTIGGSGRVKSASQVVLGSRVMPASTTNWRGTSKPYSTGSYSGNTDKTFTFTAANPGNIAQGTVNINWNDGVGNSGTVNFGAGYNAPLPVTIRDGLQIGFDTGTVNAGDVFTVAARLPRDTFSYTINSEPYVTPVVVVSYNDPQGNHKFVTPVEVSDLGTNLAPYASQMLPGVGVDISTNAAFNASGNNTVYLIANSPHTTSITNGHLFVEFVNDAGTVVAEQVYTQTLQSGPTVKPVTFHVSSFNPAYQAGHDYTLLAFFTDSQGNIIDSHARLFSTFGADPQPVLNTSPASWNFGTVTQGAQPQQTISIVNTGIMPLNVVVGKDDPAGRLSLSGASGIITIPPAGTRPVIASLDTTTLSGAVSMSITIRSNDPAHQTVTVPVNGTVGAATGSAAAFDIANRPLDKTVRVYGNVPQFTPVDFTHGIQPDTATIEPCKVYAADGTTLKGVGKYCTDFNAGTVSAQVFGTGADGALTVTGSQTINNTRTALSTTSNAGQPTLNVASTSGFAVGQEVLIHQTQGTGAGGYEFGKIASIGSGTLTLQANLQNMYTQGGNSRAQVIRVPHYTDVTIQSGATLSAPAWDGSTGGILAFRATGTLTINGTISASGGSANENIVGSGGGFRGGLPAQGANGSYADFHGYSGEGTGGASTTTNSANGNGGGGGFSDGGASGGAGGGNATTGGNSGAPNVAYGGNRVVA